MKNFSLARLSALPPRRLLALCFLPFAFSACNLTSNTIIDESGTLSGRNYWCRQINVTSTTDVNIDLTSNGPVDCFFMDDHQYTDFQFTLTRGSGMFQYNQSLSVEGTTSFSKGARLPAGTWSIVVVTPGLVKGASPAGGALTEANFTLKVTAGSGATAGGGYTPPASPQRNSSGGPSSPLAGGAASPPRPLKLTFISFDDAIDTLSRGQPTEREAALHFISTNSPPLEKRSAVVAGLASVCHDQTLDQQALPLIEKLATKDDAAVLRSLLEQMVGTDPAHMDDNRAIEASQVGAMLLAWHDAASVAPMIRLEQAPSARATAQGAVTDLLGQDIPRAQKRDALTALMRLAHSNSQHAALQVIVKWASHEDAPAMQDILNTIIAVNPSQMDQQQIDDALLLARILYAWGEDSAVMSMVHLMNVPSAHDQAAAMLTDFGPLAETTLLDALKRQPLDSETPQILNVIANVGTEKSVDPLQMLMSSKNEAVAKGAADSLNKLAARLKLKPEAYLTNLTRRYVLEGPAGFVADTTMTTPNTLRWTRQAPGRAAKSSYTVQVLHVAANYQLAPLPDQNSLQAGTLTFQSIEPPAAPSQFTRAARMAALDGEYLIEITGIIDSSDTAGQNNITNAVKKIHAR